MEDDFDYVLEYPNYALGIMEIGPFFSKAFVAIKQITNGTTKETKDLLCSPTPIIIKKGTKRSLIPDSILLSKIGVVSIIILIDNEGKMHWTGQDERNKPQGLIYLGDKNNNVMIEDDQSSKTNTQEGEL